MGVTNVEGTLIMHGDLIEKLERKIKELESKIENNKEYIRKVERRSR